MVTLLTILFVLVCILLIFMVVITPSQEGGLASAFGGMGSDSFFGTKAGRHINRFTVFLAVAFMVLAIAINWLNTRSDSGSKGPFEDQKPPENTAPAPGPGDGHDH